MTDAAPSGPKEATAATSKEVTGPEAPAPVVYDPAAEDLPAGSVPTAASTGTLEGGDQVYDPYGTAGKTDPTAAAIPASETSPGIYDPYSQADPGSSTKP